MLTFWLQFQFDIMACLCERQTRRLKILQPQDGVVDRRLCPYLLA
jgi:hypothetical protein